MFAALICLHTVAFGGPPRAAIANTRTPQGSLVSTRTHARHMSPDARRALPASGACTPKMGIVALRVVVAEPLLPCANRRSHRASSG